MTGADSLAVSAMDTQWQRIVAWCATNAPATAAALRPSAGEAAVLTAQEATGVRWPAQLRAWYLLHDGVADTLGDVACVLAGYAPLPLEHVVTLHHDFLDASRDFFSNSDDLGEAELMAQPAGAAYGGFLPAFIPIADGQVNSVLVCDLRPGPGHGLVMGFDVEDMWPVGPLWPSVKTLLKNVASALESGSEERESGVRPAIADVAQRRSPGIGSAGHTRYLDWSY